MQFDLAAMMKAILGELFLSTTLPIVSASELMRDDSEALRREAGDEQKNSEPRTSESDSLVRPIKPNVNHHGF